MNPPTVAVIISSLNEENLIEHSLSSLLSQNYLHGINDVTFYLADSHSTDRTREIAKDFVDNIVLCPRGKLNARDKLVRMVSQDIIVNADADRFYSSNWLGTLIDAVSKDGVVAATGSQELSCYVNDAMEFISDIVLNIPKYFNRSVLRINGGNSAFLRQSYLQVGGFNLGVNQLKFFSIWIEEEIKFAYKMSRIGKVVKVDAIANTLRHDSISHYCFGEFGNRRICS
ncbi:hypothetical protein CCP3SC5AM1_720014 [Gammaproteobacteria bacterium]